MNKHLVSSCRTHQQTCQSVELVEKITAADLQRMQSLQTNGRNFVKFCNLLLLSFAPDMTYNVLVGTLNLAPCRHSWHQVKCE